MKGKNLNDIGNIRKKRIEAKMLAKIIQSNRYESIVDS